MKSFSHVLHGVLCVAVLGTASSASAGTYFDTVMADNPVSYWRLNETSGTAALDAKGLHSGTYFTAGAPGGVTLGRPGALFGDPGADTAAYFNGSNQKVDVPFGADLNPASFSFETWAKIQPGSTTSHMSPMTSRSADVRGYIFYAEARRWQFWSGPGWHQILAPANSAVEGRWYHLVGTYDAATQTKSLYVDGQLAGSAVATVTPNVTAPLRFGAGATEGAGSFWFRGDIDEPAVYNYALSPTQVLNHYNAARPATPAQVFFAGFANPGGVGLGPDASRMVFSGQTGVYPTPSNPDGALLLGGGGTGGMVFTDDLPRPINFFKPLVVETEAYYLNADAPAGQSNAYFGLKALYLHGVGASGTDRLGGLWAQWQPYSTGTGNLRIGFQSGSPAGGDLWFDSGSVPSQVFDVTGFANANGPFTMRLSIYGLGDNDDLVFSVIQGAWSAEVSTTIGQYRNNLPAGDVRNTFDRVLSELRAAPWRMDFGLMSTDARVDAYNYLAVFANVPEPSSVLLLALGGVGLAAMGWRRARRK